MKPIGFSLKIKNDESVDAWLNPWCIYASSSQGDVPMAPTTTKKTYKPTETTRIRREVLAKARSLGIDFIQIQRAVRNAIIVGVLPSVGYKGRALGRDYYALGGDAGQMHAAGEMPRAPAQEECFAIQLLEYARMATQWGKLEVVRNDTSDPIEYTLFTALRYSLNLHELLMALRAASSIACHVAHDDNEPIREFLRLVFANELQINHAKPKDERSCVRTHLARLTSNLESVPASWEDWLGVLLAKSMSQADHIWPHWPSDAKKEILKIVSLALSGHGNEFETIRERFFQGEKRTHASVGKSFVVSKTYISLQESKAFQHLRHEQWLKLLRPFVFDNALWDELLALRRQQDWSVSQAVQQAKTDPEQLTLSDQRIIAQRLLRDPFALPYDAKTRIDLATRRLNARAISDFVLHITYNDITRSGMLGPITAKRLDRALRAYCGFGLQDADKIPALVIRLVCAARPELAIPPPGIPKKNQYRQ